MTPIDAKIRAWLQWTSIKITNCEFIGIQLDMVGQWLGLAATTADITVDLEE